MGLVPAVFLDPTRITDRLFGGPHFMSGFTLDTPDGVRFFSQDCKTMWIASTVSVAWREGFNYAGHKAG